MKPLEDRFWEGLAKRLDQKIQDGLDDPTDLIERDLDRLEDRLLERLFVKLELGFGGTLGRAVRKI